MKRVIFVAFLVAAFFIGVGAFGVDFGANLYNGTAVNYNQQDNKFVVMQSNIAGLWVSADFFDFLSFFVKGSYTFSYATENPPKKPHFFDVDSVTIKNTGNVPVVVTGGRFSTSDFSHYVFNGKVDGLSVELNIPLLNIYGVIGYNGLLFKERSTLLISRADILDLNDDNQLFASPRIVGGINFLFPDLFLKQDLNLGLWSQFDLRSDSSLSSGEEKVSTLYYGIGLKGDIIDSLYYDMAGYFESGWVTHFSSESAYNILSYMGNIGFSYYLEKFLSSKMRIEFLYSSGDADYTTSFYDGNTKGNSSMFIPISRTNLAMVFKPGLGNIFLIRGGFSIKPLSFLSVSGASMFRNIQTTVETVAFFRSTTGAISETGLNTESSSLFLGTEIDAKINAMLFSDLGVFISGGIFIPATDDLGAFSADERSIEGKASVGIFFEF